jgi:hypothetical protein
MATTRQHHKTDKIIQSTDPHEVTTADVLVFTTVDKLRIEE